MNDFVSGGKRVEVVKYLPNPQKKADLNKRLTDAYKKINRLSYTTNISL